MALEMHSNMLAVYPHIIARLKTVPGIRSVHEVGELAALMSGVREKRKVAVHDGGVYVVFGGAVPEAGAGNGKTQSYRLHFTFALCHNYLSGGKPNLYEVGKTLTAIQAAFQGWDAGAEYAVGPFRREPSPPIEYNDGFAFYPVSFAVDVVTVTA